MISIGIGIDIGIGIGIGTDSHGPADAGQEEDTSHPQ